MAEGEHPGSGALVEGAQASLGLVLGVDDDPLIQKFAKAAVEWAGFSYVGVTSGEQCLHALETLSPQIIMLDVLMPGLDGFETCQRVRSLHAGGGPRIIFVTACNHRNDVRRAIETSADDYVVKPFNLHAMRSRLHHWIRQSPRQSHAQTPAARIA